MRVFQLLNFNTTLVSVRVNDILVIARNLGLFQYNSCIGSRTIAVVVADG